MKKFSFVWFGEDWRGYPWFGEDWAKLNAKRERHQLHEFEEFQRKGAKNAKTRRKERKNQAARHSLGQSLRQKFTYPLTRQTPPDPSQAAFYWEILLD